MPMQPSPWAETSRPWPSVRVGIVMTANLPRRSGEELCVESDDWSGGPGQSGPLVLDALPAVAVLEVVVHDAEGLHRRVDRRRAEEATPAAAQLLGQVLRLAPKRGKIRKGARSVLGHRFVAPYEGGE